MNNENSNQKIESIISRGKGIRFIKVREDFVEMCEGDVKAAMVLDFFEYLTMLSFNRNGGKDFSFTATYKQISEAVFGCGYEKLSKILTFFEKKELVFRIERNNDFDTNRYLVNVKKLNELIDEAFGTETVLNKVKEKNTQEDIEKMSDVEKEVIGIFEEQTGLKYKNNENWNDGLKQIVEMEATPENVKNAVELMKNTPKKDGTPYIISSTKSILSFLRTVMTNKNRKDNSRVLVLLEEEN